MSQLVTTIRWQDAKKKNPPPDFEGYCMVRLDDEDKPDAEEQMERAYYDVETGFQTEEQYGDLVSHFALPSDITTTKEG